MSEVAVSGPQEERPTGFLGLMRNRNYALLWSGQMVSEMGNRFHWVAVSLWIYAITRSATAVSLAISSMFVGSLLVSLWAGVFVDRLNRKTILILSDLIRAGLVTLIPSLISVNLWFVYLDLALVSVATAFFRPAIFAVVPQVVNRRDLLPANSFFTAMDTGTEIVGPMAAGLLAQSYGYAPLLYLDAITYLFSATCIYAMSLVPLGKKLGRLDLAGVWHGVVEGLRYVRGDSLQYGLFVLIFPATLVGAGLNALQTPISKGVVGISDAQFGTFQSVWGIGFVVGSLLLGWYGAAVRRSRIIIGGYFLAFLGTSLMGLSRTYQDLLVTAFLVGFANTLYYVGLGTVLMEHTPGELVGRVVSTRQVARATAQVVSPLIFGAIAETMGIRQAITIMAGLGTVATAVTVWRYPSIRRFDSGWKGSGKNLQRLLRFATDPIDPDYHEPPQRWLNVGAVTVVLIGWILVALENLKTAAVLLITIAAIVVLVSQLRRRGRLA